MEELCKTIQDAYLNEKGVKFVSMADNFGKKIRGNIENVGTYHATQALRRDISAKVSINVKAEDKAEISC